MAEADIDFASLRISTDALPARERLPLWREQFGRSFLKIDIEPLDDAPFQAEAIIRVLPGLRVMSCATSSSRWQRTLALTAGGDGWFGIAFQLGGRAGVLAQRRRSIEVLPGDAVAISHSEPAALCYPSGPHMGMMLPLSALAPLVGDVEAVIPHRIPKDSDPLRLLRAYLGALADIEITEPEAGRLFVTHIHDLVALAIGATGDGAAVAAGRGVRAARLRAVKADIAAHLTDRDLSVTAVARRQQVTPRYVQMLFEDQGTTFSQFVLAERLLRVHRALTDPHHDHATIAAIAYASGFGDLSYFNRAFRRRYGASPSDVRHGLW